MENSEGNKGKNGDNLKKNGGDSREKKRGKEVAISRVKWAIL